MPAGRAGGNFRPVLAASEWFAGDNLGLAWERPRGLPIANLTSQRWGNIYFDDRDHWIADTQAHGACLRYTEDFMLFNAANDSSELGIQDGQRRTRRATSVTPGVG